MMSSTTVIQPTLDTPFDAAADRWQEGMRPLLQALLEKRRSAMVLSEADDALEWVSRRVVCALKAESSMGVELIHATSTDRLLARFNSLLESMPLAQARQDRPGPLTVWVLSLRRELELPEVRLLLNLVQDFPGAGVRLLVLCSRGAAAPRAVRLAATWGSRLHRWVVAPDRFDGERMEASAPPITAVATRQAQPVRRWLIPSLPRRAWGVGGVALSLFGVAATWLAARADHGESALTPPRRPVPEVVELLEDVRPAAVRQDQRS